MTDKKHRNALPKGHVLHWYEIESVLGRGGFGMTYLARDLNLNHQVAIKEFLPGELVQRGEGHLLEPLNQDKAIDFAQGMRRFMTEARTLARFKHPNIVRVVATFEANNTAYMVMEYEQGRSLRQILKKCGTLTHEDVLRVLLPIMDGLQKVHENGFIHRDIKPDNIFIRKDHTPVLLDFGSARQSMSDKPQTLTAMVTPGYAPYEQYQSESDLQGPWTDIYGLAATIYRAIAGVAPMDALERGNALIRSGQDNLVRASEIGKEHYSSSLLEAIDLGLAFREAERPQSIAEWRRSMAELIASADTIELPNLTRTVPPATNQPAEPTLPATTQATLDESQITVTEPMQRTLPESEQVTESVSEMTTMQATPAPVVRRRWPRVALAASLLAAVSLWVGMGVQRHDASFTEIALDLEQRFNTEWSILPLDRQRKVRDLLLAAEADLAENRLTTPAGNNALEKYRQVFELDESNSQAGEGLARIIDRYELLATGALNEKRFDEASAFLDRADLVIPDTPQISHLRESLRKARSTASRQHQVRDLLRIAALDMKAGRYELPVGDNAREKYLRILELQAGQPEAVAGLKRIDAIYEQQNPSSIVDVVEDRSNTAPASGSVTADDFRRAGEKIKNFFTDLL